MLLFSILCPFVITAPVKSQFRQYSGLEPAGIPNQGQHLLAWPANDPYHVQTMREFISVCPWRPSINFDAHHCIIHGLFLCAAKPAHAHMP